jgi:rhamnosyltransferase
LSVRQYGGRMFDEAVALRRMDRDVRSYSRTGALLRAAKGSMADTWRILRDPDFRLAERVRWSFVNPAYHFARWNGLYHGGRVDLADEKAIARRSWEAGLRRGIS